MVVKMLVTCDPSQGCTLHPHMRCCLNLLSCHNKIPWSGGLNNRNRFLTVLKTGNFGKGGFILEPLLFIVGGHLAGEPLVFLPKGTNPIMRASPSLTSSNPNYLIKAPSLGIGLQHMNYRVQGVHKHSAHKRFYSKPTSCVLGQAEETQKDSSHKGH